MECQNKPHLQPQTYCSKEFDFPHFDWFVKLEKLAIEEPEDI